MNPLKQWVVKSREEQRRAPERYLASYPQLRCDDEYVYMTWETFQKIERNCGRYDGTLPTGAYLGKMFLRGRCLMWFSIDRRLAKSNPPRSRIVSRKVVLWSQDRIDNAFPRKD